jgi:hypothetical protein
MQINRLQCRAACGEVYADTRVNETEDVAGWNK